MTVLLGVDDPARAAGLVVVRAGADDQDVLAPRGADAAERADVSFERGLAEAGAISHDTMKPAP